MTAQILFTTKYFIFLWYTSWNNKTKVWVCTTCADAGKLYNYTKYYIAYNRRRARNMAPENDMLYSAIYCTVNAIVAKEPHSSYFAYSGWAGFRCVIVNRLITNGRIGKKKKIFYGEHHYGWMFCTAYSVYHMSAWSKWTWHGNICNTQMSFFCHFLSFIDSLSTDVRNFVVYSFDWQKQKSCEKSKGEKIRWRIWSGRNNYRYIFCIFFDSMYFSEVNESSNFDRSKITGLNHSSSRLTVWSAHHLQI